MSPIKGPMKLRTYLPALAGTLVLGACNPDLTVPNYNNPSIGDLKTNPTNSSLSLAVEGVIDGSRQDQRSYVLLTAHPGREAYYADPNEGRYIRQLAAGVPDGSDFTGGSFWTIPYSNIRLANTVLAVVDNPSITFSAEQKAAVKGFTKTLQALDFLMLSNTREKIALDVNIESDAPPAAAVDRATALKRISDQLDDAAGDLQKAGSASLPFTLSSGYKQFGFTTPAKLLQFNRALKARVEVYRATEGGAGNAGYQAALTALSQSFLNATDGSRASLNTGVYHSYSPSAGDRANPLYDPASGKTFPDPRVLSEAPLQTNGRRDARLLLKVDSAFTGNRTVLGVTSPLHFALYETRPFYGSGGQSSPIPVIRNEELILLRAESRWFTGDKAGAISDLNFIRTNSGGLVPTALTPGSSDAQFVTELLQQRRYSLLFEGGHRWIDYRRFNRMSELGGVPGQPSYTSFKYFPVPIAECLARGFTGSCTI